MPTSIPTQLVHSVQIVDPKTGLPTQDFTQLVNAIIRALVSLDGRLTDLEP